MKLSKEVAQRMRHIEIHTRKLLSGSMIGDYSSARKGAGLEFDQIREYELGDDVRFIDWNASARGQRLLVKQYIEERNRTVLLIVDRSASTLYGTTDMLKSDIIAESAAVLALVADYGKDHVGGFVFSDEVKKSLPAQRGRKHVHAFMEMILSSPVEGKTSLTAALKRILSVHRQASMVFIISDFLDTGYENLLKIVARHHDVIAVRCTDPQEHAVALKGLLTIQDPESGKQTQVSLGNNRFNGALEQHHKDTTQLLQKCGVDILDLSVDKPFIGELVRFFRRRMSY